MINTFPNKGAPLDKIPTLIFKKTSHILTPIISELFNLSIRQGVFPSCLKTGRVIPIFKSGKKDQTTNYRPITTLPVLAKIFEKLAHKRMTNFIDKFNLIGRNQFGFLAGHNTSDALLEFLDKAYDAINQNKVLLAIFLDFSKAFDTVDHEILLKKLDFYGFRGTSLQWIRSFLNNRTQFVEINQNRSSVSRLNVGVPQGSTLGPLLFLLYINDLSKSLTQLKSIHFADDTTLYLDMKPSIDHTLLINTELTRVQSWINANKLSLNVQKTNYMIISNRMGHDDLNICLNGQSIERTDNHKFLGVLIDDKLRFNKHVEMLCSKMAQSIGMMRRISHLVPTNILKNLYYTMIYSRFTYAITTWGSAFPSTLSRLESLVKKAITLVTTHPNVNQTQSLYNFTEFQGVYDYFVLCKMFKIVSENKHPHFTQKIHNQAILHNHETRSNVDNHLVPPRYTKTKCQNSFIFRGIKLWNTTHTEVRQSATLTEFKERLKRGSYRNN